MDWGLISFTRDGRIHTRAKLNFPLVLYLLASIINLTLRFSWYANRLPQLKAFHSSQLVLMVEAAEVGRRAMWNMIRIEWEVIDKTGINSSSSMSSSGSSGGLIGRGGGDFERGQEEIDK